MAEEKLTIPTKKLVVLSVDNWKWLESIRSKLSQDLGKNATFDQAFSEIRKIGEKSAKES